MANFIYDNFPKLDVKDLEGSVKKLSVWLEQFNDQLGYVLGNLTINDNFNQKDLDNFYDSISANLVITKEIITNNVLTTSLYAKYGDVAELTVDWLTTTKKIQKCLQNDTSIDNYININAEGIQFISALVQMNGGTPLKEQATDRNGANLYWEKDITYAEIINGNPFVNGRQVLLTTGRTEYIAYIYKYTNTVKRSINFTGNDVADTAISDLRTYVDSKFIAIPTYSISGNQVSISASAGAIIRYTVDGSDVGANSNIYTTPITLATGTTTIKAYAQLNNKTSEQITINVTI